MLFKLSLKNIKKSFKDYAIYFFTLILGVAIFYVFNAIESQTVLIDATSGTANIIELMTNMLSGVSVFVSFILGFLIIYASRFLIKRRKREFGIYLTLGMSKRRISMILFIETILIGLISLVIGLGIGIVLSQLMSILVANMFEADMTKFSFILSKSACIKCLIYFGIMYLLVMIFNTINIGKCKLIDLLHSSKKSEKVKLKNSLLCTIIFLISASVLGFAYYMVTGGIETMLDSADKIFIPIALGIVSTFFIFWSLSGLILRIVSKRRKFYYKGLNSFTLRQISSKINTTVFSMTIICLMLFVTICILSSSLSIKNSMTANLEELAPVDVEFTKMIDIDTSNPAIIEDFDLSIIETLEKNHFDVQNKLKDIVSFNIHKTEKLTLKETLGREVLKKYKFMHYDAPETIIALSDYNKVARLFEHEEYTLKKDEYMIIADYDGMIDARNLALKERPSIVLGEKRYQPKYDECKYGFLEISSTHINGGIIVVPDEALESIPVTDKALLANFNTDNKEEIQKINQELRDFADKTWENSSFTTVNTKLDIAENSIGLGALVTFIGLYLGIIFLISSAAILALKELSESSDNKERFRMLRKIGTDEVLIRKALFRQIAIFFLFPLILAIVHSVFGIMFCNYILETFGNEQLLPSIIMTSIFIIIIYGGYFLITYFCSKNILRDA